MASQVFAQQDKTINGTVRDDKGETMPGVSVTVKGTTNGTVTDVKGHYTLKVNNTAGTLVFSFVGFTTSEVTINKRTNIDAVLKESDKTLSEVVVIGYGTVKKRDLTGSVASVSGKDIAATPVPNIAQAMQGKLPGVSVVSQDGRPGASINIRVRGGGSISQSNQPLILIDGIPGNLSDIAPDQVESIDVLKEASTSAIYGSRGANGVVLVTTKSAKAGKTSVSYNGYAKFNTPTKYLEALAPYDYLKYVWANSAANAVAFQTPFEQLFGLGSYTTKNPGGIESYRDLPTDDIQRQVYGRSTSMSHALTLTGGTDKTKMLFSINYADDQGMKLNSYQKRTAANFKVSHKVFDNVTFDLNARYSYVPTLGDESTTSGSGSILSSSYRFRPIATNHILGDLAALQNSNIQQYGTASMWDTHSPVARTIDNEPLTTNQNFIGIASLNWEVVKGLVYHTDYSMGGGWGQRQNWSGATYNNYIDDVTGNKLYAGNAAYTKSDNWNLRWANTLAYEFNINKANKLNVLVGTEVSNTGGTSLSITATRFPSNFTKETAFAQINQYDSVNGSLSFSSGVNFPVRLNSYFGRANYSLLDRYLFTFTFREDGSSQFAPGHQWGFFPGAAFAWRVSDESFMKNISWLDNLKLRVAYGSIGNNQIPNATQQLFGSVTDQRLQYAINHTRTSAYQPSSYLANPNVTWETTVTRGIGTDFGLFGGRLTGTVDLYWNYTKDLLFNLPVAPITGYLTTYANVGQTSNKGIEISLNGTIWKNKDWKVTAGGNINFNKNNIDQIDPNVNPYYSAGWAGSASYPSSDYVLLQGNPVGLIRGLTYDGIYTPADFTYNATNGMYTLKPGIPDIGTFVGVVHGLVTTDRPSGQVAYPGLPKFVNRDDSNNKIDDNDLSVIGKTVPVHTGGFNFNVSYKNIDLGLNFNWSYGNDIYNANKLASLYGPKEAGVYENKLAILNNAYKIYDVVNGQLVRLRTPDQLDAANANATLPLSYGEMGVTSTLGIEKGSFLRLNTLTLGYSVPTSILSKIHISNLRLYGSIYNVATITGYSGLDPEVNVDEGRSSQFPTTGLDYGTYPRARSFIIGLNLGF
ncbi:TonB-dependent receptor [Mucilaginibacter sp. HMF5004]|uniref:SusC/RagA family TonB-linked outer membrane protein n=1 Tax=Mucilaginibacter rivuli TaxID=2857527 RepID=UPI001C5DBAF5|nr:TonB-dependent receptor [Mucilaginibacter rivuli]MBW4888418.1 TonB-dependent receptor [Mucilaginibacter rivuli]